MTLAISSPVTGSTQTGLTSPTYTVVQDSAVSSNAKRYIVTALGGTQTGVRIHTVSDEFSVTFVKPLVTKAVQAFSSLLPNSFKPSYNRYWMIVKKGGLPAAGLSAVPNTLKVPIDIAAGCETYDNANVRAMLSFAIGCLSQVSNGLGDTVTNGAL